MLDSKFRQAEPLISGNLQCTESDSARPKSDLHCTKVIDWTSVHPETVSGTLCAIPRAIPAANRETRVPSDRNYLADALILMSTPAGRLNLFNASIVLAVAWTISINRL